MMNGAGGKLAALCLRNKVAVLIRDLEPEKGFHSTVCRVPLEV